jgi:uncharacterized protein YaiL (DUF2058 family)
LLGLGFKPPAKPDPRPQARDGGGSRPGQGESRKTGPAKSRHGKSRSGGPHAGRTTDSSKPPRNQAGGDRARGQRAREDIDLAKAYAIRAQREKDERIAAEAAKQEAARLRREGRVKLHAFLQGKALNREDADIARHFEYGGKIKRIYVSAEQLKELNAGKLGVVQDNGRYLLVSIETLNEAETIFAAGVAFKIDPNAPPAEDPYADPSFQVPDDLVW